MGECPPLYTVGHSNLEFESFVELLAAHGIEALIDIRSQPSSRFAPQFNRASLRQALPPAVRYAFMGDLLGGRPGASEFYDEAGHVLYGPLSRSPEFNRGLEMVERNCGHLRMALMCSEADPLHCHRFLLVTRMLAKRGWDPDRILHVLPDGSVRSEAQLAFQGSLLEESWRSPLSVLPDRQPAHSSADSPAAAYHS
jgi:uncharacterized protein (DUF488 family)